MVTLYKELGARIRDFRKTKKLTSTQFANCINVSTGQLSNIENGNYDVFKLELLNKIAKELNISLGELIQPNSLDLMKLEYKPELNKVFLSKTLEGLPSSKSYLNQYLNSLFIAYLATISEYENDIVKIESITNHIIDELRFIKSFHSYNRDVSTL